MISWIVFSCMSFVREAGLDEFVEAQAFVACAPALEQTFQVAADNVDFYIHCAPRPALLQGGALGGVWNDVDTEGIGTDFIHREADTVDTHRALVRDVTRECLRHAEQEPLAARVRGTTNQLGNAVDMATDDVSAEPALRH